MFPADDPLFQAIVSAHADPDPRMARRFSPFSPAPLPRHIAALLPFDEGQTAPRDAVLGLIPSGRRAHSPRLTSLTAAASSLLHAVLRPLPMIRSRQSAPCCTPGCA